MQVYPIDFVRQLLVQTLYEMNYDNGGKTFGGSDQVNLFSFYEQLEKQDEVYRFVEIYRDFTNQENRTGLIMNGVVIAPENPTITNLYQELIVPLTFTCSFRVRLGDRDKAQETINQLIRALKGRKFDMGLCENGEIIKVGTIGHGPLNSNINSDYSSVEENSSNLRKIQKRAYIGSYNISNMTDSLELTRTQLIAKGFDFTDNSGYYYAIRYNNGGLYVVNYNSIS